MTQTSFNRDNILSNDERLVSASKCLTLLEDYTEQMRSNEASFVESMVDQVGNGRVSERQLAWLRDLVEKYAQ